MLKNEFDHLKNDVVDLRKPEKISHRTQQKWDQVPSLLEFNKYPTTMTFAFVAKPVLIKVTPDLQILVILLMNN